MLKLPVSALFGLFFAISVVSAQWTDDFSDGDFLNVPEWTGNTDKFIVDAGKLRLNDLAATAPLVSYLSTASDISLEASWSFVCRMDFNPSSTSYAKVYLISDQPVLTAPLNGYYLRLGSTDDDVCLFKQTGNSSEMLISGRKGALNHSSNELQVTVTRDAQNGWTLKTQLSTETEWVVEGTATDSQFKASAWFGVVCVYISSRNKAFHFDDFHVEGKAYSDTEPPVILFVENSQNIIQLVLSEPIATESVKNEDFIAAGEIFPENIAVSGDQKTFTLTFPETLACGTAHSLLVKGLTDLNNNPMRDSLLAFSIPCRALPYDIVISEVMANPTPSVHLPEYEYIELHNRSGKNIDLGGWTFRYGNTGKLLPPYLMPAGSYALLVHPAAVPEMEQYGTLLPVLGAQAAISNAGQYLSLQNDEGAVISWLDFAADWYADNMKDDGGWSLEMIDPEQRCSSSFNWKASTDPSGGTPGRQNAVFTSQTDMQAPQIQRIAIPDNYTIILYVSKSLENISPVCTLEPAVPVSDSRISGTHFDRMTVSLGNPLQDGQWYGITIAGDMTDCSGYAVPAASFRFALPQAVDSLDVIINEVLFQPLPGNSQFIELYNRSQKMVQTSDLQIALRNSSGTLSTPVVLSSEPFLMLPGQYIVLSRNTEDVIRQFNADHPENFLQMPNLPALTKESGKIVLLSRSLHIVDEIHYNIKTHTDLLSETAGVSLERLNPDRSSLDPTNWHTAAQTADFGTPGKQNSQYLDVETEKGSVTVCPPVFSPDNDGVDDVLSISYQFETPSLTADLIIFDSAGRRIRQLLKQNIVGTEGVITWDGLDDSRRKALTGVYIILLRVYNSDGFNKLYKIPAVLAGQRN